MPADTQSSPSALAPEDYYLENGLVVFTAAYHLKRGTCCGSGCRHCPYPSQPATSDSLPAQPNPITEEIPDRINAP